MTPFVDMVQRIEQAYCRLGHEHGWRFLYTPARTLSPSTRLTFIGLNPGGSDYEPPSPSVEAGNAYHVEPWGKRGQLNSLQRQIVGLFEGLAKELGHPSSTGLMDETLAANFCPFRSQSLTQLARREESLAFSQELWISILDLVQPAAVVCLGGDAAPYLREVLRRDGFRQVGAEEGPFGWTPPAGQSPMTYAIEQYRSGGRPLLFVRLPHLSRFPFVRRTPEHPESVAAVQRITQSLAAALRES